MKTVNRRKRTRDEGGVILLLSLLLLAALTAAGIGASTVVINEFKTAASTDQGISAYYTADIAMERGLFAIFNNRLAGSPLGEQSCTGNYVAFCQVKNARDFPADFSLGSGRDVSLSDSTVSEDLRTVNIVKDGVWQLDLVCGSSQFYPECGRARTLTLKYTGSSNAVWAEVQWSYVLKRNINASFTPNSTTRVISNAKLKEPGGATLDLAANSIFGGDVINPPTGTTPPINPDDIAGYTVRIRALYDNLTDVSVSACIKTTTEDQPPCDSSNIFSIPGDIHVVARGQAANAKARLDATVPWRLPAAGLFDFVVFSESSLDKPN